MKFHQRLIAGLATFAVASALPVFAADRPDGLYAILDTTKGEIVIKLEYEKTPMTVANFVGLAEGTKDSNKPKGTKFYDGVIFHRVIPGFMIQGGDPEGTGRGGPGYKFPDEFDSTLSHTGPGILSMANSGPGTNGSQFFITLGPTPHLNNKHTVFGNVVEGQDVVKAIGDAPSRSDKPNTDIVMKSVTIERVGSSAKNFKSDQAAFDALLGSIKEREAVKQKAAIAQQAKQLETLIATLQDENDGKEIVTTDSGLKYIVLTSGTGGNPAKGAKIKAHYTGKFVDGRVFDSSVKRGQPIEFSVGVNQVIKGWDEALVSMKKGEKRILIIPSDLAYGPRGRGPIPPNTPLVFEVELIDF
jgi:peptidylprolyl isomerase